MPIGSVAGCIATAPSCLAGKAASAAAGAAGGSILGTISSAFSKAEGETLKFLMSAWVNIPTPQLSSSTGTVGFLQSSLSWYVAAAAVLGLLVAAGRLAIERKPDAAKEAATGMLTTLLTIGAGVATISLLSSAGDAFSSWIIGQAANGGTAASALSQLGSFAGLAAAGPGLIIVLAIIAIVGMLVQLAMILIRSALLVVLVGIWPLAASASMTEMGRQWFKKITAWIIAFLLFKPAAAIVYAAAIKMTVSSTGALGSIEGVILIILASLTLPALMKFIVPAVSAVGSMGAGEVVGAGIAAATGAAMVIGTAGIGAAAAGGAAMAGGAAGGAAGGVAGGGTGGAAPSSGGSGSASPDSVSGAGGDPPEGPPAGAGPPSGGSSSSSGGGPSGSQLSRGVATSQLVGALRSGGGASHMVEEDTTSGSGAP